MIRVGDPQEVQIVAERHDSQLDELSDDDGGGSEVAIGGRENLLDHHQLPVHHQQLQNPRVVLEVPADLPDVGAAEAEQQHDAELARVEAVAVVLLHQQLLEVRLRVLPQQQAVDVLRVLGVYAGETGPRVLWSRMGCVGLKMPISRRRRTISGTCCVKFSSVSCAEQAIMNSEMIT